MRTKLHQTIQSVSCLTGDVYDPHFETHLQELIRMTPYEPYERRGVSNHRQVDCLFSSFSVLL